MTTNIVVSVVITFFREGALLAETIESALEQTFQDYEIVLVDNNADESTLAIAKYFSEKFPEKVRLVKEKTPGKSSARNKGISESLGKYIALLDGDDLMKPERLQRQYDMAISNPEAFLISSSYEVFIVEKGIKDFFSVQKDIHLEWVEMIFRSQKDPYLNSFYVPLPSTLFFDRKKVMEMGGFDPFFNLREGEDIYFAILAWGKGRFFHLDDILLSYRAKSRNLKNKLSKHWIQRTERQDRIVKTLYALYCKFPKDPLNGPIRKLVALWLRETSLHYFSCIGGKKFGKELLKKSFKCDPISTETWKLIGKSYLPEKFYPRFFWFDEPESLPAQVDHELFIKSLFKPVV